VDVRVCNHTDAAVIIEVQGEVDLYTSPRVREAIVRATRARTPTVVVDLAGVAYMDSSGVATLVEGLQFARGYGGAFRLAGLGDTVRQVFKFAKLDKVFEIYSDAQGALAERKG
jgi:anti-sigma B factor antagonist